MKAFLNKYRIILILLSLLLFISFVDKVMLSGWFKGIETYKHFLYIGVLVFGVLILLRAIIKEDDKNNIN